MKDLGVIPQTFPTIGDFGGVEQIGDGRNNLQIDSNLIVRYNAADITEVVVDPKVDDGKAIHNEHPIATTDETESNVPTPSCSGQTASWRV